MCAVTNPRGCDCLLTGLVGGTCLGHSLLSPGALRAKSLPRASKRCLSGDLDLCYIKAWKTPWTQTVTGWIFSIQTELYIARHAPHLWEPLCLAECPYFAKHPPTPETLPGPTHPLWASLAISLSLHLPLHSLSPSQIPQVPTSTP